jgi:hypothetical protein
MCVPADILASGVRGQFLAATAAVYDKTGLFIFGRATGAEVAKLLHSAKNMGFACMSGSVDSSRHMAKD